MPPDLSLTTTGNATAIVCENNKPIIATDPWLGEEDDAYFGSWNLQYKIPTELKDLIKSSEFLFFSHGHPDHLNPNSINKFKNKKILLADHYGNRIVSALKSEGYSVKVVPDRQWVDLSKKVKIFCITTQIQNSVLLIDVNGILFVDLNDAHIDKCGRLIRSITKTYKHIYLLSLSGWGDADMINFYDDEGNFIEPLAANKPPVGGQLSILAKAIGANKIIPFSSFHHYQREDSVWANDYVTPIEAYSEGVDDDLEYIRPFVTIDCNTQEKSYYELTPTIPIIKSPLEFGDDWDEKLHSGDFKKLSVYFAQKELIKEYFGFLSFKVGGETNTIKLDGNRNKGIAFEVPRNSLIKAIEWEIFDDLLIGNFMRTTLLGIDSLYEDVNFNYTVTKYGDNGGAKTKIEMKHYIDFYKKRIGHEWYYHQFLENSASFYKRFFNQRVNSPAYKIAKKLYVYLRS